MTTTTTTPAAATIPVTVDGVTEYIDRPTAIRRITEAVDRIDAMTREWATGERPTTTDQ